MSRDNLTLDRLIFFEEIRIDNPGWVIRFDTNSNSRDSKDLEGIYSSVFYSYLWYGGGDLNSQSDKAGTTP